jgi:hypothetical protein
VPSSIDKLAGAVAKTEMASTPSVPSTETVKVPKTSEVTVMLLIRS